MKMPSCLYGYSNYNDKTVYNIMGIPILGNMDFIFSPQFLRLLFLYYCRHEHSWTWPSRKTIQAAILAMYHILSIRITGHCDTWMKTALLGFCVAGNEIRFEGTSVVDNKKITDWWGHYYQVGCFWYGKYNSHWQQQDWLIGPFE